MRRRKINTTSLNLGPNAVPIIGLKGQSNMGGLGDASELPPELQGQISGLYIWDGTQFVLYEAGVTNQYTAGQFGPELKLGTLLQDFLGQDVYMVKLAQGGTSVWDDPAQDDWNAATFELTAQYLFDCKNASQAIRDTGKEPAWLASFDRQGESDADTTAAAVFEANKRAQYQAIRDVLHPDLPIIISRIHDEYSSPAGIQVRTIQETLGNEAGAAWFDTDSLDVITGDENHFGTQGQLDQGELFFESLKPFLLKSRVSL